MDKTAYAYLAECITWLSEGKEEVGQHVNVQYTKLVSESFYKQFCHKEGSHTTIRVSSLGKPAVLQSMNVLGYNDVPIDLLSKYRFHMGDTFEAYLIVMMDWYFRTNYNLKQYAHQAELEFNGITGHIDFVQETPAGAVVIEAKTMNDNYFQRFTKAPDDNRGYVTQLAIYSHCLGIPAFWVAFNKGTHELAVVAPEPNVTEAALIRANKVIPPLKEIRKVEQIWNHFSAPPPVPEIYRKTETGLYMVPESMRYSQFSEMFYAIGYGKDNYGRQKRYVVEPYYNDATTATKILTDMGYSVI